MRAGASGFLLKDVPSDQLVAGIRIVAAGDALLAPALTRRLIEHSVRRLTLLARVLSNSEIAAILILCEASIKTHIGRILNKLGLRDHVQAVVFAYESGVVQPGTTRIR
jgi:DNA-binding NarL/FixJ family response regulator